MQKEKVKYSNKPTLFYTLKYLEKWLAFLYFEMLYAMLF